MKTPEDLLRENVRALISLVKKKNKNTQSEDQKLRAIIREFLQHELKEAKTPDNDPAPHQSTGINVLEDLLKKIIPQIEDDYKLLTTSEEQRESYRAHIIQAVVQTLTPVEVNNAAPDEKASPEDLDEEIDIDIKDEDEGDDMFIDIDPDSGKDEEEEVEEDPRDAFGIEGKDTTGRNMAYTTFKKIESQIIDAYDMLSNPEDQEVFFDYLIANLKLYFDKFENEIQPNVEEPTNKAYDDAKQEQPASGGDEGGDTLDLEI
jgi:sugar-specific transcriptional regulator TrmB